MNKMAEVAKLLGLEWDEEKGCSEEFTVKDHGTALYMITKDGIIRNDGDSYATILLCILEGKYEIKKQPWKPQFHTEYWYADAPHNDVYMSIWSEYDIDNSRYELGLIARTKEEAEVILQEVTAMLKERVRR